MKRAYLRFYAELNDFLSPSRRMAPFAYSFDTSCSVKDMIEGLGVPHTEVDLILVNGESVGFSYAVQNGDYISVYPVFESIDIRSLLRVRSEPLRETRFVLDTHLGRLAGYLRMMGFDTLYRNDYQDEELVRISTSERRLILTRDRGLLKRRAVTRGYFVRATEPRQQLAEVLGRFDLYGAIAPFERCLRCNGFLQATEKQLIQGRLQPKTKQYFEEFWICEACDRIYWKGSHYQRMHFLIERMIEAR